MEKSIYKDYESIKAMALHYAKEHMCNYNIILKNPNEDGSFCEHSTYEFVTDSYFNKERPNVILLERTDNMAKPLHDIIEEQQAHKEFKDLFNFNNNYVKQAIETYNEFVNLPGLPYYRVPQYRRETPKVQRNEPCSCGSGKKYKKCCG